MHALNFQETLRIYITLLQVRSVEWPYFLQIWKRRILIGWSNVPSAYFSQDVLAAMGIFSRAQRWQSEMRPGGAVISEAVYIFPSWGRHSSSESVQWGGWSLELWRTGRAGCRHGWAGTTTGLGRQLGCFSGHPGLGGQPHPAASCV